MPQTLTEECALTFLRIKEAKLCFKTDTVWSVLAFLLVVTGPNPKATLLSHGNGDDRSSIQALDRRQVSASVLSGLSSLGQILFLAQCC